MSGQDDRQLSEARNFPTAMPARLEARVNKARAPWLTEQAKLARAKKLLDSLEDSLPPVAALSPQQPRKTNPPEIDYALLPEEENMRLQLMAVLDENIPSFEGIEGLDIGDAEELANAYRETMKAASQKKPREPGF